MKQEDLNRFLASVKKARLLDYLDPQPGEDSAEEALNRKIAWAETHQDQPEHADEAQFLLDNVEDLRELSWEEDLHTDEWLEEEPSQKSVASAHAWSLTGDALGEFMQTDVSSILSAGQPSARIRATDETQSAPNVDEEIAFEAEEVPASELPPEPEAEPAPKLQPLKLTPSLLSRSIRPQVDQGVHETPDDGEEEEEEEVEEEPEEAVVEEIVAEESDTGAAEEPQPASSFSRLVGWFGSWMGGTGAPADGPAAEAAEAPSEAAEAPSEAAEAPSEAAEAPAPEPTFEPLRTRATPAPPPVASVPPTPSKKRKKVEHPPFRPFEICAGCGSNLLDQTAYYSSRQEWMCGPCFRRERQAAKAPPA